MLSYFVRNPRALDDLEGVTRLRIREEAIHRSVEEVAHALAWLVSRGFLVEQARSGARRVFSLNPEMVGDAARFLHEADPAAKDEVG